MLRNRALLLCTLCFLPLLLFAQRSEVLLDKGWHFSKGDWPDAASPAFDDSAWERVRIPHDWAIYGPFDRENDLQKVAVTQNLEQEASVKTGRSGGLPYVGIGWYRTVFNVKSGKSTVLLFDGAMSEAHVFVNGHEVCFWPYGYNAFWCDVTSSVRAGDNLLAVRLENKPSSSRWYPGAGLYRNVHLIQTEAAHIPVWGTQITTPKVDARTAEVVLKTCISNPDSLPLELHTSILDADGRCVAQAISEATTLTQQRFTVSTPQYWSPETPILYRAVSELTHHGVRVDRYETRFGIRTLEFRPHEGFFLNGEKRKFQGVCNHHDLGPLGAAVHVAALRHQLEMLKDMGCDAIRTSHNMPTPELVELCDEMGFMMMIEPFDEWNIAKCQNGYHRYFDEWAERDMVNMLHHYRNHPCVVMWSIGNEVPSQCSADGLKVAAFLQDICHREDPTRPVTCGMDQVDCVLSNGFAAQLDIPGINYHTSRYLEAYRKLPQGFVLGSETASTVSSRGVYKWPMEKRFGAVDDDHQCSAYDFDACPWSNIPDVDFALAEDYPWTLGQFVWTGFDYLGEPTPYDKNAWPNHSSMFGIIDLASIPKDRYYLYRSLWNHREPTLHVLPHWNWVGHEGERIPIEVYTSWPEAELFVNGRSYGRLHKATSTIPTKGGEAEPVENRYRLIWPHVVYLPGVVRVVAYDEKGNKADEVFVRTAGKPHHIALTASVGKLKADGRDLVYVTARIVDKQGSLCPLDSREMRFKVRGAGCYLAAANGDPTCLDAFQKSSMHAFNGQLTVIAQAAEQAGVLTLTVQAEGLSSARFDLPVMGR